MKENWLFLLALGMGLGFGGASGQSPLVIPRGLAAVEGNSRVWVPGKFAPARAQIFYAAGVLPKAPLAIRGIGIRRDGLTGSAFQAHSFDLEIWMGHPGKDPVAGFTPVWKENYPKDMTMAVKKRKVLFPADVKPLFPPAPFSVRIPLDQPFTYKGGGLFFDWRVWASKNETWEWYADGQRDKNWHGEPQGVKVQFYTSPYFCSLNRRVDTTGVWLGSRVVFRSDFPNDSRGFRGGYAWELGLIGKNMKNWGGLKLPYFLWGTGCEIRTDAVMMVLKKVPWVSRFTSPGPVDFDLGFFPTSQALVGMEFNFQGVQIIPVVTGETKVMTTVMARCTVGGGLTGHADFFTFYGYQDPFLSQGARYHRPVGLVMELR